MLLTITVAYDGLPEFNRRIRVCERATVRRMKIPLAKAIGLQENDITLWWGGRMLGDNKRTLQSFNITPSDATLMRVGQKLLGGVNTAYSARSLCIRP